MFKDVFAKELADHSPTARREFAGKLLEEAARTKDSPSDQFVLLVGAAEAGREAADLSLCNQAADALSDAYEVDRLRLQSDIALKIAVKPVSRANGLENCRASLDLIDELIETGDYDAASRLASALVPSASSDPNVAAQIRTRLKDSEDLRVSAEHIAKETEKLKTTPDDPASNLAVGQFLSFKQGDWTRGLPMLAKGSDARLRALASTELSKPDKPDAIDHLADDWRDLAKAQTDLSRTQVAIHAAELYRQAADRSSGIRRAVMRKKLGEANALAGLRIVDLLALIDVSKDAVEGDWRMDRYELISNNPGGCARVRIPYQPPEEYDYVIEFTRTQGSCILTMLSAAHHNFKWVMAYNSHTYSFDFIDGKQTGENEASLDRPDLGDGVRHKCVIRVRHDSVSALIDGKLIDTYRRGYSHFTIDGMWFVGDDSLGIGSYQSAVVFHSVELVEVSGKGKISPRTR